MRTRPEERASSLSMLEDLCRRYDKHLPNPKASSFLETFGAFTLQWEQHTEFYAITVMQPGGDIDDPFTQTPIGLLPQDWLSELPGEVVAAFHLFVTDQDIVDSDETLARLFEGHSVSISDNAQSTARIYTAFRLHGDGFGRFVVSNQGISDKQMGRLTRRLTEIETYRLFAMLAFPLAKQIAPQLVQMDRNLAKLLSELPDIKNIEEERGLMTKLSRQEAKLETWRAETNRRFSGAQAYHELVRARLERITEKKIPGYTTLNEYMSRRLDPALRTCASVHASMDDLSMRIARASDLLRTRINLTMQEQNRALLATMNRRSKLQFRLQETVEGLSVVAISYYLVGLIKYLLEGIPLAPWGLSKGTLLAVLIPFVLAGVLWMTRRIKHRLIKSPAQETE
jgi:uncharacterized membrane-anchored protein